LSDSRTLAAQAQSLGASAIAAFAPSYFKPGSIDTLVACCAEIASAAPAVPFYYYDIPSMTGLNHSMPEFLSAAKERIPTLVGLKFTNNDLVSFQRCLREQGSRFEILWGMDEYLLAALALGAEGAVGSTYNFAAPIYTRLISAFQRGDLKVARDEQYRSVQLVTLLARFGYMGAAKAVLEFLGVDVGPARLPNTSLPSARKAELRIRLDELGFFEWVRT
jgi:N-acetylneuraminate lyase